jgi:hypothetical protein
MFAIPVGMLLGANVSVSSWWLWNQIPVTLGNLVGGMVLTGLAIYFTHRQGETPSSAVVRHDVRSVREHREPVGYAPTAQS